MSTQHEHLARVADSIGNTVVEFCRARLTHGGSFVASELRAYVSQRHPGIAPESPGRVLRDLKQRSVVDYELVSRGASLYRVISVREIER